MGIEGGTEALQEGFQQVMGNLIAKGQYEPEQDVFEGAGKAACIVTGKQIGRAHV